MFPNLQKYGWNEFFEISFEKIHSQKPDLVPGRVISGSRNSSTLIPGRVISVHRTSYDVMTNEGEISAEITGNRLKDKDVYNKPVVGDWVVIELGKGDDANVIRNILPRASILERRRAHSDLEVQIMASNVDTAVIVQSLDQDFSIARIERVLVQLRESRIKPVVILNKLDIAENIEEVQKEVKKLDPSVPVIFSSYKTGEGLAEIADALKPGKTVIFIGSSGVGKSSIINTMLEEERQQKTGEVSDYSRKGKHTTTSRKLFVLDNGVIVIDTPGTREFGLTVDDSEVIKDNFSQIEDCAQLCKFNDCKHFKEPECAVQKAVEEGVIAQSTLDLYHKFHLEINNKNES